MYKDLDFQKGFMGYISNVFENSRCTLIAHSTKTENLVTDILSKLNIYKVYNDFGDINNFNPKKIIRDIKLSSLLDHANLQLNHNEPIYLYMYTDGFSLYESKSGGASPYISSKPSTLHSRQKSLFYIIDSILKEIQNHPINLILTTLTYPSTNIDEKNYRCGGRIMYISDSVMHLNDDLTIDMVKNRYGNKESFGYF
jgi:hypothetical protein